MISAFSQLTAIQIKFHHPFTLSDLVILKCCANTTCCQLQAAPPFFQCRETHYSHWSLHSPKNAHFSTTVDLSKDAIFMNAALTAAREQGWMGLDQRAPKETSGDHDGAGAQAGLKFWPAWLAELTAPWPLLPVPPPGAQGGKLQCWRQETAVSELMEVVSDVRAPWGTTS